MWYTQLLSCCCAAHLPLLQQPRCYSQECWRLLAAFSCPSHACYHALQATAPQGVHLATFGATTRDLQVLLLHTVVDMQQQKQQQHIQLQQQHIQQRVATRNCSAAALLARVIQHALHGSPLVAILYTAASFNFSNLLTSAGPSRSQTNSKVAEGAC